MQLGRWLGVVVATVVGRHVGVLVGLLVFVGRHLRELLEGDEDFGKYTHVLCRHCLHVSTRYAWYNPLSWCRIQASLFCSVGPQLQLQCVCTF
jgi:hypothetical protein